jgi:CubicO group peptidase (beta-lactamase class C family)
MSHAHGSLNKKLPELREILSEAWQRGMFNHAVLSVRVGSDGLDLSFDKGRENPEGANRLFDVASMTKTVVAFLVHIFIKCGVLARSMTVRDALKGTKWNANNSVGDVTIGELLVHSVYFEFGASANFDSLTGDDIIVALFQSKAHRGYFKYANLCYLMLGAILEARTGKSLQQLSDGYLAGASLLWDRNLPAEISGRLVPTWSDGQDPVCHDPLTRRLHKGASLSGVAGVFASAPTLATLFGEATWGNKPLISFWSRRMMTDNAVGHLPRWRNPGDPVPPVESIPMFSGFGVNMDRRPGRWIKLSSGFTGCHGFWADHPEDRGKRISAVLLTDAVVCGKKNREASQPLFRGPIVDLLLA